MKCCPKIWKKFSAEEKRLWKLFYEAFLDRNNLPLNMADIACKQSMETAAHNLACQAVWVLEEDEKKNGWKHTREMCS